MVERPRKGDTRGLFARKRRTQRRRRVMRALLGLLAVALVGATVWLVAFSSVLAADRVKVVGADLLAVDDIISVADVPLGTPLARLDVDAVAERVAGLIEVEDVEVSRSWPSTVTVTVTERTAVAWLEVDGRLRGVDRFGADFRSFDELPELTEIRVDTTDPRDRQQALEGLGSVIDSLQALAPDLLAQVEHARAETQDSLELQLAGGRTVIWGSATDAEQKVTVLLALLDSVDASVYDVSAPGQPTTRE